MPEPRRNTLLTAYPGKFVYTVLTIFLNAARLPLWMIYFIHSGLRQNPKWTWKQAVRIRAVRAILHWCSKVEMITPFDLTPGAEKDQWVNLSPVDSKYYTGVVVGDTSIKPSKIGATWYPSIPTQTTTKVVLHFHGGAFVVGDGRNKDAGFLANTLLKHAKVNYICSINYRLSSNTGGRFPAALQDAITSYVYLVHTIKINSRDITFSGDSAGANLVFALLKYIADNGKTVGLESPGAAWLWSPWVDPVGGNPRFNQSPNEPTDYLSPAFGAWGARCYLPLKSTKITDSYIDILHHPFRTDTPLYFSVGENEVLMRDDFETAEKFEKLGNKVAISLEERCPHDIILVGAKTGFGREACEAAQKAGAWLDGITSEMKD